MDAASLLAGVNPAALVGVLVVAAFSFVAAAGLALFRRAPTRPALAGAAVSLALLPTIVSLPLALWPLERGFGALALTGGAAIGALGAVLVESSWTLLAGAVAVPLALAGYAAALLPSLWSAPETSARPASRRRTALFALLPVLALILAGALFEHGVGTVQLVRRVVAEQPREAAEGEEPLPPGIAGIAETSARISRGIVVGTVGAGWAAVVLLATALAAAIVAWPVRVGRGSAAWTLLVLLGVSLLAGSWAWRLGRGIQRITAASAVAAGP